MNCYTLDPNCQSSAESALKKDTFDEKPMMILALVLVGVVLFIIFLAYLWKILRRRKLKKIRYIFVKHIFIGSRIVAMLYYFNFLKKRALYIKIYLGKWSNLKLNYAFSLLNVSSLPNIHCIICQSSRQISYKFVCHPSSLKFLIVLNDYLLVALQ